jgi:hypothetical protein
MPEKISDIFGIAHKELTGQGVFDAFVDLDSPFHVDPRLLRNPSIPEVKDSYRRVERYFEQVIHVLEASKSNHDIFFRNAVKMLTFHEVKFLSLGYSTGASGSGIGPSTARKLALTAQQILRAGIKDPAIFELVGLIEEGVGADRISDMIISIILPDLILFSERVASDLSLPCTSIRYENANHQIPQSPLTNQPILLVPAEILHHLPLAFDWGGIDELIQYNTALRAKINQLIGKTWKRRRKVHLTKGKLRELVIGDPSILEELVKQYKAVSPRRYDFENDPLGMLTWKDIAQEYAEKYPLDLPQKGLSTSEQVFEVVQAIVEHFKQLVEENGLSRLLYDDTKKLRHEHFAQLLFFGVADAYCAANNIDLSPEVHSGNGPVDFKISKGYDRRVTVEVKYSSNPQLVRGYTRQLPAYNRAEHAAHSIFLIIRTTPSPKSVQKIQKLHSQELKGGNPSPEIFVVDGRVKPSASKLR